MTSTDVDIINVVDIVGDMELPCDYAHNEFCRKAPAKWALWVICGDCGFGGHRLAGTDCKDLFMNTEDLIECPGCEALARPKDFLKRIERL